MILLQLLEIWTFSTLVGYSKIDYFFSCYEKGAEFWIICFYMHLCVR